MTQNFHYYVMLFLVNTISYQNTVYLKTFIFVSENNDGRVVLDHAS